MRTHLGHRAVLVLAALASTAARADGAGAKRRAETPLCELPSVARDRTPSIRCIACHDGTVAAVRHGPALDGRGDHPVAVDYEMARLRRPGLLRPAAELPASLVRVDGRVECTTCHDGRQTGPARLAMSLSGSAMCLACHAY